MHLSKALAAKLAAAVLVVSALVTPTLAANVGTVTSDSGLNLALRPTPLLLCCRYCPAVLRWM